LTAGTPEQETIHAYRLVKKRWTKSAFDGEGAKLFGGRWNSRGRACVYLSRYESLAILEVLVHLENTAVLKEFTLFQVSIKASDILALKPTSLPANWREEPAPPATADIGDEWLDVGKSLGLEVPSVIVPRESNFLINPNHAKFSALVRSARELEFSPDSRL